MPQLLAQKLRTFEAETLVFPTAERPNDAVAGVYKSKVILCSLPLDGLSFSYSSYPPRILPVLPHNGPHQAGLVQLVSSF